MAPSADCKRVWPVTIHMYVQVYVQLRTYLILVRECILIYNFDILLVHTHTCCMYFNGLSINIINNVDMQGLFYLQTVYTQMFIYSRVLHDYIHVVFCIC